MACDLLIPIIMGIVTGIISGFISSVLVTRLARFENLRSEAQRQLRSLEYMKTNNDGVDILGMPDTKILTHTASDFYALGHKKAGEQINRLISKIHEVTVPAKPSYFIVENADREWQRIGRSLKPSMLAIFRPRLPI